MSITDELRSCAARMLAGWKILREEHDELTAIADRIDAEHEAKVSYWQGARTCKRVMDSIDPFTMWVCDHCGHPLDTSENFCGGCGRRIVQ